MYLDSLNIDLSSMDRRIGVLMTQPNSPPRTHPNHMESSHELPSITLSESLSDYKPTKNILLKLARMTKRDPTLWFLRIKPQKNDQQKNIFQDIKITKSKSENIKLSTITRSKSNSNSNKNIKNSHDDNRKKHSQPSQEDVPEECSNTAISISLQQDEVTVLKNEISSNDEEILADLEQILVDPSRIITSEISEHHSQISLDHDQNHIELQQFELNRQTTHVIQEQRPRQKQQTQTRELAPKSLRDEAILESVSFG